MGNIYQILSQYVVINWAEQNIKYQESGTLQINNGTCYYSEAKYQWQISTNNGKTWNNLEKGSGQISSSPSSLVFSDITYKVQKETNNALYRLEIINDNNSNEVLYSNSLSPNDNLVSANITFANNLYNLEQKNSQTYGALLSSQDNNIDLVVSLSQFGKNTTNEELLKELSGNITLTTQYFNNQINLTNLWQYYNKQTNQIIIPISTSTLITFENNSYSYDYNATNSQYVPISLSLTINQNQSEITSNTLTITPEDANINLTSTKAFNKIKDTYYCQYGQSISLTSNNSNLNFPSSITYQWQYSENGTSNWQDISANGTSSSLPIDIEGNIYYRLVVGETAMGDANIYSNVIHFDSSMPTAAINFASSNNSNYEVITSFNQPFNFAAIFKQNNNTINSNSNIQIMWQYKINNGKWINTSTNPLLLTPNNVLYQYICNQTGIVNIRLEYTYNTIIQYSNIWECFIIGGYLIFIIKK